MARDDLIDAGRNGRHGPGHASRLDEELLDRAEAHHHRLSRRWGTVLRTDVDSVADVDCQDAAPASDADPKKFVKELNDSGPSFDIIDQLLKYIVDGTDEWAEARR